MSFMDERSGVLLVRATCEGLVRGAAGTKQPRVVAVDMASNQLGDLTAARIGGAELDELLAEPVAASASESSEYSAASSPPLAAVGNGGGTPAAAGRGGSASIAGGGSSSAAVGGSGGTDAAFAWYQSSRNVRRWRRLPGALTPSSCSIECVKSAIEAAGMSPPW